MIFRALYLRGDPFESSDAVFGVKNSLLVNLLQVDDAMAQAYNVQVGSKLLKHDFVLVTDEESRSLRDKNTRVVLDASGIKYKFWKGLPIPEVD